MATPEQEAFIYEMMHKKPGEVWKELWDARVTIRGLVTPEVDSENNEYFSGLNEAIDLTPAEARKQGYVSSGKVFHIHETTTITYPDGDWFPLPFDDNEEAMEYMRSDSGTIYIRPVDYDLLITPLR